MIFGFLTLLIALTIASVAAWFSIEGLMAIFSASALQIAIMAGTLEVGKLLTASWLYRYWHTAGLLIKTYLTIAVLVLMLITSMGIFGYLSKAHLDQAGISADAIASVERVDSQIEREQNKISIFEERIQSISNNSSVDVSSSIQQQESIREEAGQQVQGDIEYNQNQITSVREQLTSDLSALDSREQTLDARISELDRAVNDLRSKGVEVIETDAGGAFRRAETETIDYVTQANQLREAQQTERSELANQKAELNTQRQALRTQANADIRTFQSAIDRYRAQAQTTIDNANAEINRLRSAGTQNQDDILAQIDDYNSQIDEIYNNIAALKDERFQAQSVVRGLEKEVGPIKYVAELIYGEGSQDYLDKSVRLFILMLVFVFDPLAVILLIAANQTLMQYGINLEKGSPDGNPTNNLSSDSDTGQGEQLKQPSVQTESNTSVSGLDSGDNVPLQQQGAVDSEPSELDRPSSVDDAATAMLESAARMKDKEIAKLKKELKKKPKEVEKIVHVDNELELNVPVAIQELEKRLQEKLNGK